jgi:hypothetical protein
MALDVAFSLTGDTKLMQALSNLAKELPVVALMSLVQSGEEIMTDSKENYVPVDTGNLRASGLVTIDVPNAQVNLSYGGPAIGYAIYVHEIDKNYNNGKSWKYLQAPLMLAQPKIVADLIARLDTALKNL